MWWRTAGTERTFLCVHEIVECTVKVDRRAQGEVLGHRKACVWQLEKRLGV